MRKYEVEYKESIFSTLKLHLKVESDAINCYGIIKKPNDKIDYTQYVTIPFEKIIKIELDQFKKYEALHIEADTENGPISIYFPNITDVDGVKSDIIDAKRKEQEYIVEKRQQEEIYRLNQEKRLREAEENKKLHEEYVLIEVTDVIKHNPTYIFEETQDIITFMFIDANKDLIIKSVDKTQMNCIYSTIEYGKIHYYEKAGAIHYVSDINVNHAVAPSYGGSFIPGKIHLTPAVVGGLLFGPMGLAVGAMMGYNKMREESASIVSTTLNIDSVTKRIDERSVIFNYFSDKNQQYMDIEFPQETYNYLQTHLAEKKYDIVLAIEKQTYASKANQISIEDKRVDTKMSIQEFEDAVKKLKLMKDNELISEEEFIKKKESLLLHI